MTGMLWLDAIVSPVDTAADIAGQMLPVALIAAVAIVTVLIVRKRRK